MRMSYSDVLNKDPRSPAKWTLDISERENVN
jgi:hypothetical protein